ncbi:hypothetical protein [Enterococcus sp. AZ163]|uniref:hypothetical protein n=1 Tax=Enterococcus sp. AZ163 TaxID=2774638 RepID=UPI003D26E5E1
MKKLRLGKIIFGLAATAVVSGAALVSAEGADAATLYRAYNPNTGEHLYTANGNEIPFVVSAGWKNEGTAWEVPSKGTPVYRVFNPNNGGDHHYTLNYNEVTNLQNAGWKYEGIAWQSGGSTPVHRLYNPNEKTGTHHFTMDANEKDALVKAGWKYEGVAMFSGSDQPTTPTTPTEPSKPKDPTIVSGWVGNTGKVFQTYSEANQYGRAECLKEGSQYSRWVNITIVYSDGSEKYSVSLYEE